MWWRYFNWCEMTLDELTEDSGTLGGLQYLGEVGHVRKSTIHRYRFPPQDHSFHPGDGAHRPHYRREPRGDRGGG